MSTDIPSAYPPGHYHSPIPSAEDVKRALSRPEANQLRGIDLREQEQLALLKELAPFYKELPFPEQPGKTRYYYDNGAYCYADGVFLFLMLRHARPARIIEVGSGFSSVLMLDVNERFFSRKVELTLIEPNTERLEKNLRPGDLDSLTLIRSPVQEIPAEYFTRLEPRDVLFIDSTHVAKAGSDVNYLLFEVLPVLKPGVLLHFHDIFYPFEYPAEWLEKGIYWNEAYLLRALLSESAHYRILLMNTFLAERRPEYFAEHLPLCLKNRGGSLWLEKL